MKQGVRRAALAGVVAALCSSASVAAWADDPVGRIDHVETAADGQVRVLYSVPGLGEGVIPDPGSVTVKVNGGTVTAVAETVAGGDDTVRRTSILAIDVSNSMRGASFTAAKEAALTYIEHAPADVYVGLVTFAGYVETAKEPTQDRASLVDAVTSLKLSTETRLYDGVLQALELAGDEGQRSVLVLSDGKDTSTTNLSVVTAQAKSNGARIDVVALNQTLGQSSPLSEIASASKGTITRTSDLDRLEALFASEADDLAKQLQVTFTIPDDFDAKEGTLAVSVDADGQAYRDSAFVSLARPSSTSPDGAGGYTPTAGTRFQVTRPVLIAGIGLMFLGVGGLLAFGMTRMMPAAATPMQQQLSLYTADGMRASQKQQSTETGSQLKGSAVRLAESLVQRRDFETKLAAKLDRAGLSLKAAEWLLLHAGIAVGSAFVGLILTGGNILPALLLFAAGAVLPWMFLSFKASRRIKNFNGALAQTLQVIAGALQAGLSLPQAVDTVVQEGEEVVAEEFRRAIVEQRLGVEIEDALDSVADRMNSDDFKWVVMAVRIQREVGGNLSELLLTVAGTLREREYLRRQVSVLSAEGRLSAWILGGLPPLFLVYLILTKPTYVAPMFDTSLGLLMLGTAAVMMVVGSFWLSKSVKVEV